jgi:hypothetical protein
MGADGRVLIEGGLVISWIRHYYKNYMTISGYIQNQRGVFALIVHFPDAGIDESKVYAGTSFNF